VLATETPEPRPLEAASELVEYFRAACKSRERWRVGTENELIGVYSSGAEVGRAPAHEGPRGIGVLLERIGLTGWSPILEDGQIIALGCHDAQVTLEPGGQLELAARPVVSTADFEQDLRRYEGVVAQVSAELGIAWLGLGFRPFGHLADVPWMPKGRYRVMREYLPTRGGLAHEMMKRTATVQVNMDFSDADDAGAKLRCVMSVTPLLTGLYANSPVVDGAINGYQSYRAHVWHDVDPDRCGLLPFAFDDGDIFEKYVQWALDVPMFFVYRGERYVPAGGMTFRAFMRDGFQGERPSIDDWELHLSTVFPEARVKKYIEIRGCDAGSQAMVVALGPLCRGLLYDSTALAAATELTADLSFDERLALGEEVARRGLAAPVGATGHTVGELARELVEIAHDGLGRVAPEEQPYLDRLREIAETGRTQADAIIEVWQAAAGDPETVIAAFRRFA